MKKVRITFLILLLSFSCFAQKLRIQIDSLAFLDSKGLECESVYWRIIAKGKEAVPLLIEKIQDTTLTKVFHKCKTKIRTGDLAYFALEEIISLPNALITKHQFCVIDMNGCSISLFEYIESNRKKYSDQLKNWYATNEKKLKWQQYDSNHLFPCRLQNNIKGRYELRD